MKVWDPDGNNLCCYCLESPKYGCQKAVDEVCWKPYVKYEFWPISCKINGETFKNTFDIFRRMHQSIQGGICEKIVPAVGLEQWKKSLRSTTPWLESIEKKYC